jgi:flagellar capping protein FliD
MNKMNGRGNQDNYVGAGFHRLDKNLVPAKPPRIKWGDIYKKWPEDQKVAYLEKLASSMNHAARLIQGERDQLGRLCEQKERQIITLKKALDENNVMIQSEITRMNEDRQQFNAKIASLNKELRELSDDDNG